MSTTATAPTLQEQEEQRYEAAKKTWQKAHKAMYDVTYWVGNVGVTGAATYFFVGPFAVAALSSVLPAVAVTAVTTATIPVIKVPVVAGLIKGGWGTTLALGSAALMFAGYKRGRDLPKREGTPPKFGELVSPRIALAKGLKAGLSDNFLLWIPAKIFKYTVGSGLDFAGALITSPKLPAFQNPDLQNEAHRNAQNARAEIADQKSVIGHRFGNRLSNIAFAGISLSYLVPLVGASLTGVGAGIAAVVIGFSTLFSLGNAYEKENRSQNSKSYSKYSVKEEYDHRNKLTTYPAAKNPNFGTAINMRSVVRDGFGDGLRSSVVGKPLAATYNLIRKISLKPVVEVVKSVFKPSYRPPAEVRTTLTPAQQILTPPAPPAPPAQTPAQGTSGTTAAPKAPTP